jgi:hypothetical protein
MLQEDLSDGQADWLVLRMGFVNLPKVVLVLMLQKVVLQMRLRMLSPSSAILDLFLLDLFG